MWYNTIIKPKQSKIKVLQNNNKIVIISQKKTLLKHLTREF